MTGLNDGSRLARKARTRERAARTIIVPDFPEIVRKETQCRVCKLVEDAPELLHDIHSKWKMGAGVKALETEMKLEFTMRQEDGIDHRCFARHFKNHVDFSETTMAVGEILEDDFPEDIIRPIAPAPPLMLTQPRPEDIEAGAGDYFDMQNVIDRLRSRMHQLDDQTAFVDKDGRVNSYGMVIWLRLVSELRQSLEALNRMRNSDRLTKAILQAHTKRFAQLLSGPLVARFETVLERLQTSPEDAIFEMEQLAHGDVKSIVLRAAEESVRESCEVYKLQ